MGAPVSPGSASEAGASLVPAPVRTQARRPALAMVGADASRIPWAPPAARVVGGEGRRVSGPRASCTGGTRKLGALADPGCRVTEAWISQGLCFRVCEM